MRDVPGRAVGARGGHADRMRFDAFPAGPYAVMCAVLAFLSAQSSA
jgi:hypothetical protein